MKPFSLSLSLLLAAAVFIAACGAAPVAGASITPPAPTETPIASHSSEVTDCASLLDELRRVGATVEANGEVEQPFFSVKGRSIRVNGNDVQVFEYASAEEASAQAALVALDGGSVGASMMMWAATPNFFRAGRVIVLYAGNDALTLDYLSQVLGLQFAGGPFTSQAPTAGNETPVACQPSDDSRTQFVNAEAGYCLAYPSGFELGASDPLNVFIAGPGIGEGPETMRAVLNIVRAGQAAGSSAEESARANLIGFDGTPITFMPAALGGEAAVVTEDVPGRFGARMVFAVHNGALYVLILQPVDSAFPEVAPDVTELWEAASESFTFLP